MRAKLSPEAQARVDALVAAKREELEVERTMFQQDLEAIKESQPWTGYKFEGTASQVAKKKLALWAYCVQGVITDATRVTGITRKQWYNWCEVDPEFQRAAKHAEEVAVEALEIVAARRGKFHSDQLLMFLIRGGKPGKFKDRTELTGPNGQPVVPPSAPAVVFLPTNNRGDEPQEKKPNG